MRSKGLQGVLHKNVKLMCLTAIFVFLHLTFSIIACSQIFFTFLIKNTKPNGSLASSSEASVSLVSY